ncbi:THAP domain-containing protein 9 [Cyphomyrmex costatus]|uniref:THAP domain-containing protein 9 n=1 Tax=Cyphomyrmex costatus TaxID=456900 RepID=A0A151IML6_9HYME|nr:THAP domain-containing protein 9 [Cyphomyrmex costatus]
MTNIADDTVRREFEGCLPTANFCLQFNNMTDVLNCKNVFSKDKYDQPLTEDSYAELKASTEEFEAYINSLCDKTGKPILTCARKTGFLGIIICIRNMFDLFDEIKLLGQKYLLTYKLSQDFLETFFGAIRARGGFNNNPNAVQIKSAYKRLLIRHQLKEFETGNCLFDGIDILHVTSNVKNVKCPIGDVDCLHESIDTDDHDYVKRYYELSPYVDNIVLYIAGYVAKKVSSTVECDTCRAQLVGKEMPFLSAIKNRGPLYIAPSEDVCHLCRICEKIIRENLVNLTKNNFKRNLINQALRRIGIPFCNNVMDNHILFQDVMDNHRIQLCQYVIDMYINIRLFHEARKIFDNKKYVRNKFTKLVLFHNT